MTPLAAVLSAVLAASSGPGPAPSTSALARPAAGAGVATEGRTLSLEEAVRLALANRPELRAARAGADSAGAAADELRAALLPQLGATASYARERVAIGTSRAATGDALAAQVTLEQLVWDFGKSAGSLRAGRALARAEEASAREVERGVVREVRRAYAEARARAALAGIAAEVVESRVREVERVAALVEVGSKPGADLARARSDAAQARVELVKAGAQEALARARLAGAIGLEGLGALLVGDDEVPEAGEDRGVAALVAAAVEARPALREAEARVRASEETLSGARAGWLPRLSLVGSGAAAGPDVDGLERSVTAGAALSWSLFDGGAARARVRQAEAGREAALGEAEAVKKEIRLGVDEALAAIAGARAARAAAAEAVGAAAEDLRLAEARYQTGAGTLLEVSTARSALATAAGQGVQAEWDLSAGRADLAYAVGG